MAIATIITASGTRVYVGDARLHPLPCGVLDFSNPLDRITLSLELDPVAYGAVKHFVTAPLN